jgi:acetyl esterase/lipase
MGRAYFVLAIGLLLSGCSIYSFELWRPVEPATPFSCAVMKVPEVAYQDGPEADPFRHRLDLYLPKDRTDFPVVVLVHGGGWMIGDNRGCGLYSSVGDFLARHGIGAVMPNYRLSPGVRHPEHAKDVARAVAWTRDHIARYGGRPDRLFLAGHSAGGHLAALVATDESFLRAEGLSTAELRGVIALSGVYLIPEGDLEVTLGGASANAFRLDEIMPIRGENELGRPKPWPEIPLSVNVFALAFGNDPEVRAAASPIRHVRPGLPPFLLVAADHDLPTLSTMAGEFHRALRASGVEAELMRAKNRNHNTVIFRAIDERDPVARAMLDFVRRHDERPADGLTIGRVGRGEPPGARRSGITGAPATDAEATRLTAIRRDDPDRTRRRRIRRRRTRRRLIFGLRLVHEDGQNGAEDERQQHATRKVGNHGPPPSTA